MNSTRLFSPKYRERASVRVLEWASDDHHIVVATLVGSMATSSGASFAVAGWNTSR